jgi:hypothetical protein
MVWVNFSGTSADSAYKVEKIEAEESIDQPDLTYAESDPRIFLRDATFIIKPTPTGGMAFLWYWNYPEDMTDPNDVHGLPHGAREPLIAYCLYRLWLSRGKSQSDTALMYKKEWTDSRDDWIEFVGQTRGNWASRKLGVTSGTDLYEN